MSGPLLGAAEIRRLAALLGLSPTKRLGQNFVHDPGTVRRIVATAGVQPGERILEVGPGLGSLTLGLVEAGAEVTAIEIDPRLAGLLPRTVAERAPGARLRVIESDALRVAEVPDEPVALVANLPYNVSVPVLLHLLARVPSLRRGVVMVQAEVGERLAARPGSKAYGAPSVKAAWYGQWSTAGLVGRSVFWPVPNVDSILVAFRAHDAPGASLAPGAGEAPGVAAVSGAGEVPGAAEAPGAGEAPDAGEALRERVFRLVDAAFGQRRKMLRRSLEQPLGGSAAASAALTAAGIDPEARGETLSLGDFLRIARAAEPA